MYSRLLKLPQTQSFFVFGARQVGKSTLIRQNYSDESCLYIDLLLPEWEERLMQQPGFLIEYVRQLPSQVTHVVLDEIQKIPKLLDSVHHLIEETDKIFVMSGSSAKKLKRGGANLLAGRAFVYGLFPLTFSELGDDFDLNVALHWGSLPKVWNLSTDRERADFLRAYAQTYLKEEIWNEHLIRKLSPFRKFLEVAAQCSGNILNKSSVARDVGIDLKTVDAYYQILEDTWLGFFVEPFHHSFRKRLSQKPKFYFFDLGVLRTLRQHLTLPILEKTSYYGEIFEYYLVVEIYRLTQYLRPDDQITYLSTASGLEIDLVIQRPGKPTLLVEIKSTREVREEKINAFERIAKDFPDDKECILLSQDPIQRSIRNIHLFHWKQGLEYLFDGITYQIL